MLVVKDVPLSHNKHRSMHQGILCRQAAVAADFRGIQFPFSLQLSCQSYQLKNFSGATK